MWRKGTKQQKNAANNNGKNLQKQIAAVAVDSDKNSQHALKWAADHIIARGQIFFLIHVRKSVTSIPTPSGKELPISEVEDEIAMAFRQQVDYQTKELFLPFQCFCSRRGLNCKEVILDSRNIAEAIVEFVQQQEVEKLVLGASRRNAFTRSFLSTDLPTSVSKTAPEFCSVYVISKGKISSSRPATCSMYHQTDKLSSEVDIAGNQFQSTKSETLATNLIVETPRRFAMVNNARGGSSDIHEEFGGVMISPEEHHNFSYQSIASCPSPSRLSIDQQRNYITGGDRQSSNVPQMFQNSGNELHRLSVSTTSDHSHLSDQIDHLECTNFSNHTSSTACYVSTGEELVSSSSGEGTAEKAEKENLSLTSHDSQTRMESETSNEIGGEKIMLHRLPESFSSDAKYRRYSIEEIQEATNNFSDVMKIGEGGYGPVFKCSLDYTNVAVKIPRTDVAQGMKQFQQEVEVLSCIRHPNMVLLMGACPEYGCLVYEYMGNGSLEDRLFCRSGTPPLTWQLRFKIAAEIATGLLFLHQTKPEPIVHRDLKPANILLDDNFVSKVTDVGLARLIPTSTSTSSTRYLATVAAGTFCYIDPEYQKTGTVGMKSDTYALGIILLQLITGRRPMGLTYHIENALEEGRLEDMLDPNVPDWPMEEIENFAKVALACAELRRRDRPDLASVVLPELNRLLRALV